MCTMISQQVSISGSGKGPDGWFPLQHVSVSYDHPFDVGLEYALNLDFGNEALGPSARTAVELDAASARALVATIQAVLARAEAGGFLLE